MDARTLHFKLVEDKGGFAVELSVDGALPITASFPFDLREDTRTFEVLRRIETGGCDNDDLRDVGSQLWASLLSKDVGRRVEEIRAAARSSPARLCFQLEVPARLARLPWEALYDMRDAGFVATAPDYTLVRHPPDAIVALQPSPPQTDKLRVLVVIPEGSFLNVDMEWKNIERAFQSLGGAASVKRLGGRVSPIRLASELKENACDVVHFIGHGEIDGSGGVTVRLNDEVDHTGEIWLDAEDFGGLFRRTSVRLALLNCCLGAYPSEKRTLSGLGPYLLRAGVPAVVAMRYEIPDEVAVLFSTSFYKELLSGEQPGRADIAVQAARKHVSLNKKKDTVRGFVTPVLFCARAEERLFDLKAARPESKPPAVRRAPKVTLPPRLVDAAKQGRIVPVIGPGILSAQGMRSASGARAPTLGALARRLAEESSYPEMGELALGETAGDWLDALLLQRICQHYEQENERYLLTSTVLEAHPPCDPPAELESIAAWSFPGVVYTHFDGLMELAFRAVRRAVRVANAVDQSLSLPDGDAPLLLHLRGSVTAKDSLVLTEQDHDALWDSFNRIDAQVVSLVNGGLGRSLLFLGVSPRDIFVKRFISQLLNPTIMKNLGPVFFVRPLRSKVDEACWKRFRVQWLDIGLDVLIEELTAIAREGTGR